MAILRMQDPRFQLAIRDYRTSRSGLGMVRAEPCSAGPPSGLAIAKLSLFSSVWQIPNRLSCTGRTAFADTIANPCIDSGRSPDRDERPISA
jgi:hypothetical protein